MRSRLIHVISQSPDGSPLQPNKRMELTRCRAQSYSRYADQVISIVRPASVVLLFLSLLGFAGCAAFGVPATTDPAGKLRDATALFDRQDRPLPAERLIREALELYQKNGDQLGVAEAYRTYGFFFRSGSVGGKWSKFYRN